MNGDRPSSCSVCGSTIPENRVSNALRRNAEPKYCKTSCYRTAKSRRYRQEK